MTKTFEKSETNIYLKYIVPKFATQNIIFILEKESDYFNWNFDWKLDQSKFYGWFYYDCSWNNQNSI